MEIARRIYRRGSCLLFELFHLLFCHRASYSRKEAEIKQEWQEGGTGGARPQRTVQNGLWILNCLAGWIWTSSVWNI